MSRHVPCCLDVARDIKVRSRHGAGYLVQCTVLCTVQVTVWVTVSTLFMGTVHSKKKKYRIFKNFLLGDVIYKIFIWHV